MHAVLEKLYGMSPVIAFACLTCILLVTFFQLYQMQISGWPLYGSREIQNSKTLMPLRGHPDADSSTQIVLNFIKM